MGLCSRTVDSCGLLPGMASLDDCPNPNSKPEPETLTLTGTVSLDEFRAYIHTQAKSTEDGDAIGEYLVETGGSHKDRILPCACTQCTHGLMLGTRSADCVWRRLIRSNPARRRPSVC